MGRGGGECICSEWCFSHFDHIHAFVLFILWHTSSILFSQSTELSSPPPSLPPILSDQIGAEPSPKYLEHHPNHSKISIQAVRLYATAALPSKVLQKGFRTHISIADLPSIYGHIDPFFFRLCVQGTSLAGTTRIRPCQGAHSP